MDTILVECQSISGKTVCRKAWRCFLYADPRAGGNHAAIKEGYFGQPGAIPSMTTIFGRWRALKNGDWVYYSNTHKQDLWLIVHVAGSEYPYVLVMLDDKHEDDENRADFGLQDSSWQTLESAQQAVSQWMVRHV